MPNAHLLLATLLAMIAFAGNSVLCRLAFQGTEIDAASFTGMRLLSGALVLWLLVVLNGRKGALKAGSWWSALALFLYAATFSFAYLSLATGTGALLLFGAVQVTMIGAGLWRGERLNRWQSLGLGSAFAGLVGLLLPGISAPPFAGAVIMLTSGVAWGVYSLRGRGVTDATRVTAGNFMRAVPLGAGLFFAWLPWTRLDAMGLWYAVLSGGLTSALGYALWYRALSGLNATQAATVQLSVPIIAALGGILWLSEPLTLRFLLASVAVLGGVALVIFGRG
ncbi:DMT family transporter [Zobellella maritima]|uniref:DMT family transporter n=1 Tax=Zobellella maritima TaxID=2059725 RepID=UPI000E30746A|nr:DMT family transporter [Zobellella maritima]